MDGTCVIEAQLCDSTSARTSVEKLLKISNIGFPNPISMCYKVCVRKHFDTFKVEKEHQDYLRRIGRSSFGIRGLSLSEGSCNFLFR